MLKYSLTALLVLFQAIHAFTFCGFYVAKADAKLFNKSSAVIIARQNGQTAITMSSDFEGDVKDFAMVVPVPEVIKREQIRIAEQSIFDKLDTYSGPRLVEYHDNNPCEAVKYMLMDAATSADESWDAEDDFSQTEKENDNVTILESYTVGEYNILILSAEESDGLERWLTRNGYKIPKGASDVLEPYIKSDMKFFVVKVNLENFNKQGFDKLRPIQMTFRSDNFMLPIRLGMANAEGDQDMIVYAFSQKGRIETTNYKTREIPTDKNIPLTVQPQFGEFYVDLFDRAWKGGGKNSVMLEYAWDLSSSNYVKCDPCPTQPPSYAELREAGVFWVTDNSRRVGTTADYQGEAFLTRLHVRYNRKTFPQDLTFQETPNRKNFQGRYIMRHPARGNLACDAGQKYLLQLHERRQQEVNTLVALTGWNANSYKSYVSEFDGLIKGGKQPYIQPLKDKQDKGKGGMIPTGIDPWIWGPMMLVLFTCGMIFLVFKRMYRMSTKA